MTISPIFDSRLEFDTADRLRRALRISGVGVQEMADYLGVGRTTVSNWISGRIEPRPAMVRLFALRTGFPYEWLLTGETPSPTDGEGVTAGRLRESNPRPIHYE